MIVSRHVYRIYGLPQTPSALFGLKPIFIAPWLTGFKQCNRQHFIRSSSQKPWRYNVCCKALQSIEFIRVRSELLGGMLV